MNSRSSKTRFTLTILALLALAVPTPQAQAQRDGNPNPGVAPIHSNPYGASYGEWGARWWQWALSIPVSQNPLFDETGAMAANGQPFAHVFFLAGVFNASGIAERTITVPSGTALFFPLLNSEWDNVGVDPPLTMEQLYANVKAAMDSTVELNASLDGRALHDLFAYRAISPQPFTYVLPPTDNVLQLFGYDVSGPVFPVVTDGFWLMLSPLPVGEHTINFGGTFGPPFNFTLDITYHITVTPR